MNDGDGINEDGNDGGVAGQVMGGKGQEGTRWRTSSIDAVSCVASCVRGDVSVIGRHIIISFQMASP